MTEKKLRTPGGYVDTRRVGHVLEVTLHRPERYNALHPDLWHGLETALDDLDAAEHVTVVLLRGAGGNFCSGGDLQAIRDGESVFAGSDRDRLDALDWQHGIVRRFIGAPALTIALIEGVAVGGGFDLSLACDLRVAAADARIGSRYVRHGLVPDLGGLFLVQRAVPHPAAAAAILSGALLSGREAHQLGLVQIMAEDGDVVAAAAPWVNRMREAHPSAVRRAKASLVGDTLGTARARLPETAAVQTVLTRSEEFQQAVARFANRKRT